MMQRFILLLVAGLGILGVQTAAAEWCVTVTDRVCSDAKWDEQEFTIPEYTDSITIRYDAGSVDCAVDLELWLADQALPVLIQMWSDKCGCGVLVCQLNFASQRNIVLKVRGHACQAIDGEEQPCLSTVSAKMFWPGNNLTCNEACIHD